MDPAGSELSKITILKNWIKWDEIRILKKIFAYIKKGVISIIKPHDNVFKV